MKNFCLIQSLEAINSYHNKVLTCELISSEIEFLLVMKASFSEICYYVKDNM